jgi:hypothetical protein
MHELWEKGGITRNEAVAKHSSSIQFGQGCQYTSEAKAVFTAQRS